MTHPRCTFWMTCRMSKLLHEVCQTDNEEAVPCMLRSPVLSVVSFSALSATAQELMDGFKMVKNEVEHMDKIGAPHADDRFVPVMKASARLLEPKGPSLTLRYSSPDFSRPCGRSGCRPQGNACLA